MYLSPYSSQSLSQRMSRYKLSKYWNAWLSCDPTSKRNASLMENGMPGQLDNRLNAIP